MDWPYDDDQGTPAEEAATPTWECPDDTCQCHTTDGRADPVEFSVKSITEAIAHKEALFEFVLLYSEWTDPKTNAAPLWGFFWIFADALIWEVPNDATWSFWPGTAVEQPLPRNAPAAVNRKRLVRLPCTGIEAQAAADTLAFSQADLLAFAGADMTTPSANDKKVPCLLPTAELYDLSYLQADVRILPQSMLVTTANSTLAYAEKVAIAFDAARSQNSFLQGPPKSLGTPGKIWAIADRMDTPVMCPSMNQTTTHIACINHGFHTKITRDAKGHPTAVAGQSRGGCHEWTHVDYSQIFSAVAGWCWVQGPNETEATWKRTEAVYLDPSLCRLVRDTSPAPALRYTGKDISKSPRPRP